MGPRAGPIITPIPKKPSALPRSWKGKTLKMTLRLNGWSTPVAAPWITRAATTPSNVGAN